MLAWSDQLGEGFHDALADQLVRGPVSMFERWLSGSRPLNTDPSSLSAPWIHPPVTTPKVTWVESSQ